MPHLQARPLQHPHHHSLALPAPPQAGLSLLMQLCCCQRLCGPVASRVLWMLSGCLMQLAPLFACVQQQSDAPEELHLHCQGLCPPDLLWRHWGWEQPSSHLFAQNLPCQRLPCWRALKLLLYAHIIQCQSWLALSQAESCLRTGRPLRGEVSGFRSLVSDANWAKHRLAEMTWAYEVRFINLVTASVWGCPPLPCGASRRQCQPHCDGRCLLPRQLLPWCCGRPR